MIPIGKAGRASVLAAILVASASCTSWETRRPYASGHSAGTSHGAELKETAVGTFDATFGDVTIQNEGGAALAVLRGAILSLQPMSGRCTATLKCILSSAGWSTDQTTFNGASAQRVVVRFLDPAGAALAYTWKALEQSVACSTSGVVLDPHVEVDCALLKQARSAEIVIQPFKWTSCSP